MKTILIVVFVMTLLWGAVLWYRDIFVKGGMRKAAEYKYKIVSPLMEQLATTGNVNADEVLVIASNPSLRHTLFRVLEKNNRLDLFPTEYNNKESAAMSFLVDWLEFPTELGNTPDDIQLIEKITIHNGDELDYYVFQYSSLKPNWASKLGWMIGVAGPYRAESLAFDIPIRVFSRFKTFDNTSPQSEAQWVHDNISKY